METSGRAGNERIADQLLAAGHIDDEARAAALEQVAKTGERVEEALLESGALGESLLLEFLARYYQTQFVSTERLSRARIDKVALRAVPMALAEHFGAYPVLLDTGTQTLIVAMADPDDQEAIKELKLVASVAKVRTLVARPNAIPAAIARGYKRDNSLFATLSSVSQSRLELAHSDRPSSRPATPTEIEVPELADAAAASVTQVSRDAAGAPVRSSMVDDGDPLDQATQLFSTAAKLMPPAAESDGRATSLFRAPAKTDPGLSKEPEEKRRTGSTRRSHRDLRQMRSITNAGAPLGLGTVTPSLPLREALATSAYASNVYIESVRLLVGLLEAERGPLAGHSSAVARLMLSVCERMGLPPLQTDAYLLSAYFHDLGKMGDAHLSAWSVAHSKTHRLRAEKIVGLPRQLLNSVQLPEQTLRAIDGMYERFDGQGLPLGTSEQGICLGARILALVDSYADLTKNPMNIFGGILAPEEAIARLREEAGTIFDPDIIDVLHKATSGEKILTALLAQRQKVLLADRDPEATVGLQIRLAEYGFEVRVVRDMAEAREALTASSFAAVISELDLDERDGGLVLAKEVRGRDPRVAWVIVTSRDGRQEVKRAYQSGIDDFMTKPASPEVLCAKLEQLIARQTESAPPRGVEGSLAQMSLPDVVQVLWHSRKTCGLMVHVGGEDGEIHFHEGRIVNAKWGELTAEAAFYRMVAHGEEGTFRLDPDVAPAADGPIQDSPEHLLLEAVRLLDEAEAP